MENRKILSVRSPAMTISREGVVSAFHIHPLFILSMSEFCTVGCLHFKGYNVQLLGTLYLVVN